MEDTGSDAAVAVRGGRTPSRSRAEAVREMGAHASDAVWALQTVPGHGDSVREYESPAEYELVQLGDSPYSSGQGAPASRHPKHR